MTSEQFKLNEGPKTVADQHQKKPSVNLSIARTLLGLSRRQLIASFLLFNLIVWLLLLWLFLR